MIGSGYSARIRAAIFTVSFCLATGLALAEADDPFSRSKGSWKQDYDDQWGLTAINLPTGDRQATEPVIVAVVDTGLDYFHPDLARETVWLNPGEELNGRDDDGNGYVDDVMGWNFAANDNNPWDHAGHGTHVAGVIAAATGNGEGIAGVNPAAKIMPLKVLSFIGEGRSVEIAEAVFYAVAHGARVINLSLGGDHLSKTEQLAIDHAHENGVLVVVAAGNSSKDVADFGPAGLDNVITVGALTPEGGIAGFSNWGAAVDIAAPGVEILSLRGRKTDFIRFTGVASYKPDSAFVGPGNRYYRASGTSFAAPFVSGVASLLFSKDPTLTAEQVKRMILQSARDIELPGIDQFAGYGALDARAALEADPAFYVEAAITGVEVVRDGDKTMLRVLGTTGADRFGEAWVEIGQGESPESFTKASDKIEQPVASGALADLDAKLFGGSPVWMLRLVTRHANGQSREARFKLKLN